MSTKNCTKFSLKGQKKMVGIGKWSAKINTLVFKGEITVDIRDNNGEYDIEFHLPEKFKNVEIKYHDVHAEGNTIYGKGEITLLPGKMMDAAVTFEGYTMTGSLTLPFLGNKEIKLKDGHRIG